MSKLDLALIRVLCAIYETRSVSRAASALALTQPAVSHALNRLRDATGNPLFVRSAAGMEPTVLADHVYHEFKRGLDLIEGTLSSITDFDPQQCARRFRVGLTDIGEMVFLPPLLDHLQRVAPRVAIEACQVSLTQTASALATGQLDLAVGYLPELRLRAADVFRERYVCLFREGHPLIDDRLDKETFLACRHISVSSSLNSHGRLADNLAALGAHRDVALQISSFASLPALLTKSDFIAGVPSRVARLYMETFPLRMMPLPFDIDDIEVKVYWDTHYDIDKGRVWIRDTMVGVLAALYDREDAAI